MQNSFYAKRQGPVKAAYRIRLGDLCLRLRASHLELLLLLPAISKMRTGK